LAVVVKSAAASPRLVDNHKIIDQLKDTVHKVESLFKHKEPEVPATHAEDDDVKLWAVLVAGSNGYYNYRHQADICHAYQILKNNGVPDENIITFMYDDIANSTENPTKGIIINHPNGNDVYAGVKIDYVGDDVNPKNFLNVITGNARAMKGIGSGKVLKSGPNDHVFINFVDHGAPGLLAFPNSELHARELQDAIVDMYHSKRYGKLVMYIEACESGSMFENILSDDLDVFVTTAANSHEHSFACYYDKQRNTYLGDVYSVMWMEDSEAENLKQETLFKQFSIVRKETTTSHVQEYGDLEIGKLKVAEFQGYTNTTGTNGKKVARISPLLDAVPSGDVPLEILRQQLKWSSSHEAADIQRKIRHTEKKRKFLKDTLRQIVSKATDGDEAKTEQIMTQRMKLTDFVCYEELVRAFSARCFHLPKNEFAYRQLFVLVNVCHSNIPKEKALAAMDETCHPHKKYVGIV